MTLVAAPAPEDDEDRDVERVLCSCGRLATVVFDGDEETCWCSVVCACGDFIPADGGSARP